MQMVRQDDDGVDDKWPAALCLAKAGTQQINMVSKRMTLPVVKSHCEEIATPRNSVATVVNHPCLRGVWQ